MDSKLINSFGEHGLYYPPSHDLSSCFEHYIHFNIAAKNLNNCFIHPFPTCCIELYFHIGNNYVVTQEGSNENIYKHFLVGVFELSHCLLLKPKTDNTFYSCINIPLKLNEISNITNIPLLNFKNTILDIEEVWGEKGRKLKSIIEENSDINKIVKLIDIFLLEQLNKRVDWKVNRINKIIEFCLYNEGNITVEEITRNFNISYRTIYRIFTKQLGICPKEYLKIVRFSKVCNLLKKYPFIDWNEMAYSCGYYDQSHFIHDFKNILKVSPEEFVNRIENNYYLFHPLAFKL